MSLHRFAIGCVLLAVSQLHSGFALARGADDSGPSSLLDVFVRPASSQAGHTSLSDTKFTADGVTRLGILAGVYGFHRDRIISELADAPERYDVRVSLPQGTYSTVRELAGEIVCTAFNLKVSRETRETDVLLLKAPNGRPAALANASGQGSSGTTSSNGRLTLRNAGMAELASALEDGLPVLDETELAGKFDLEIAWTSGESIRDAVTKQLGLHLQPARRPVEFLVVTQASAFSIAGDYWLKTERKGTGYAYEHTTVAKLANGNLRYDYLSHTKIDLVGVNPQDIVETGSYVVDPELRPVSFEKRVKFQAKETHTTGTRAGDKMTVTLQEKDGKPETREIAVGDAYFGVVLQELIARHADRKNFVLNIFDDFKVDATQVEIVKAGANEIEASVKGRLFTSRYRITRDGRVREIQLAELGSRTYATDASDAQNITTLHTDNGFTLTVRSKKPFPNVYKVSRAQVQIGWEKIPFAEFRLEDNRQKVVRKNESGSKFEAVVDITRPTDAAKDPAAPMPEEQAAPYLGEDDYIKPKDQTIRRQAAAIVGETKSPSELVGKLLKWVNTNVVPELIAETLTGPEVLQKRRGKCSEYAILFASLARAAGIPTRIALGESYASGAWMGHMWDEVWLGEWIAVDPSFGAFVAGPSHLKFIDSPTVEGTQGVRFKLVDNLQIEILDFQEEKSQTALKTGISGSTYVNATFACRISAPDDTWTMKEESENGTAMLSMKPKKAGVQFALVFFAIPPGTPAGTILEGRLNVIGQMGRNYKLIEKSEADVAGRKAPSAIFSHGGKDGETIVNRNILLVDGSSGYLFALIAPEAEFAGLDAPFKTILASFDLIKQ